MKKTAGLFMVLLLLVAGLVACSISTKPVITSGVTKSGNAKLDTDDNNSYKIKVKAPNGAKYIVVYYDGAVVSSKKVGKNGTITWTDHAGMEEDEYKVQLFATTKSYKFGTNKAKIKFIGKTDFVVPQHQYDDSDSDDDYDDNSNDDTDYDYNSSSDYDDDADDSSNSDSTFSIGDPVEFQSGEKITVTAIAPATGIELMDATAGQSGVAVTATVENTGSSPLDFNAQEFGLYDGNNENANFDAESYENNIPDTVAAGMKATFTIYFDVTTTGSYSVTYGDAIWKQ